MQNSTDASTKYSNKRIVGASSSIANTRTSITRGDVSKQAQSRPHAQLSSTGVYNPFASSLLICDKVDSRLSIPKLVRGVPLQCSWVCLLNQADLAACVAFKVCLLIWHFSHFFLCRFHRKLFYTTNGTNWSKLLLTNYRYQFISHLDLLQSTSKHLLFSVNVVPALVNDADTFFNFRFSSSFRRPAPYSERCLKPRIKLNSAFFGQFRPPTEKSQRNP